MKGNAPQNRSIYFKAPAIPSNISNIHLGGISRRSRPALSKARAIVSGYSCNTLSGGSPLATIASASG